MPSGLVGVVVSGDAVAIGDAAAAGVALASGADGLGAGDDKGLLTAAGADAAADVTCSSATFENSLCHEADQFRREGAFPLISAQRTLRILCRNRHQAALQMHVKHRAVCRSGDAVDGLMNGLFRGMNFVHAAGPGVADSSTPPG